MDYASTIEKVRHALSEVADIPVENIQAGHKLVRDLKLDSISVVMLSIALEEAFKETFLLNEWIIAAEDHSQLTVESLAQYVQHKLRLLDAVHAAPSRWHSLSDTYYAT
jgi:acyl carrier protein